MHENTEVTLTRDVDAFQIPSGNIIHLEAGTHVVITQSLGGSYTIALPFGLVRIAAENADALGLENTERAAAAGAEPGTVDEQAVWNQLKTCYDPEIPVNIVDLGLVYDCSLKPSANGGVAVNVKMTLTAPGCGMGPVIASEAKSKILSINGVDEADVELVWDPPWNSDMISEAGKMKLGMI